MDLPGCRIVQLDAHSPAHTTNADHLIATLLEVHLPPRSFWTRSSLLPDLVRVSFADECDVDALDILSDSRGVPVNAEIAHVWVRSNEDIEECSCLYPPQHRILATAVVWLALGRVEFRSVDHVFWGDEEERPFQLHRPNDRPSKCATGALADEDGVEAWNISVFRWRFQSEFEQDMLQELWDSRNAIACGKRCHFCPSVSNCRVSFQRVLTGTGVSRRCCKVQEVQGN